MFGHGQLRPSLELLGDGSPAPPRLLRRGGESAHDDLQEQLVLFFGPEPRVPLERVVPLLDCSRVGASIQFANAPRQELRRRTDVLLGWRLDEDLIVPSSWRLARAEGSARGVLGCPGRGRHQWHSLAEGERWGAGGEVREEWRACRGKMRTSEVVNPGPRRG